MTSAHNDGFGGRKGKKFRRALARMMRWTRLERLEDRRVMAGLTDDVGEGEMVGGSGLVGTDHLHSDIRYLQPQYYQSGGQGFLGEARAGSPLNVALGYLRQNASRYGLSSTDLNNYVVKSQYQTAHNGVTHIALRQTLNGLEVQNADITVNVLPDGRVISVGSSFLPGLTSQSTPPTATLDAAAAYREFASEFGLTFTTTPRVVNTVGGVSSKTLLSTGGVADREVAAELVYVPVEVNGRASVELAWSLNVPRVSQGHWYNAYMSAVDGDYLGYVDWVWKASYNALPIPNESPRDGGRQILVNPADPVASPYGWHDVNGRPGAEFFDTRGNNVDALQDRAGNWLLTGSVAPTTRPSGGANLVFDSPFDDTLQPVTYTNAAVTNLFVWVNLNHDVHFRYGFDEGAGNFQAVNYSGVGANGDPVLALSQLGDDLAALNNAFMATPPDGIQPTIGMFTFDTDFSEALTTGNVQQYAIRRDGSFDAGVITHEFGHGVTTRLTGGPANSNGLAGLQSGGMGEGWSDFFALWFLQRPADDAYDATPQGTYLMGPNPLSDSGVRRFPYSFDMTINPLTYNDFNGGGFPLPNDEVHNSGEIWASALWDLNWLLIEKYGYDSDLYQGNGGNNLTMQLVIDGLKLQPTNPTFLDGRDAILAADLINNKGVNQKEIWEAFARRGMGWSADDDLTDQLGANSNLVRAAFDMPPNPSTISGTVWGDVNGNALQDGAERGLAGWDVFIDIDGDGVANDFEPVIQTDADGNYSFEVYAQTSLSIGQILDPGTVQTFPQGNAPRRVDVVPGQDVTDVDFGIRDSALTPLGIKYHDLDGNGVRDEGEPGVAGFWIYVDLDDDGRLDLGEPAAITQADGTYNLRVDRAGTFKVREVNMAGWIQMTPGGDTQAHTVTVANGGSLNLKLDFGNRAAFDWGDAPDTYKTTNQSGGPSHGYLDGFYLGQRVDVEADGVPSTNADSDDVNQSLRDEDGVTFTNTLFPGGTANFEVVVQNGNNSSGRLNAWIDFNGNGQFDTAERVVAGDRLTTGTHRFSVPVPANAVPGVSYARFRFGYERDILPTGPATAGEVEDYRVVILSDTPDARDDAYTIVGNSTANQLMVLDNDVSSRNGPILVSSVTTPSAGGRVTISAAGDFLTYTPATGFFGNETFSYTIRDQAGVTDRAFVSVTITPPITNPIAVDDSFQVAANSANNALAVLTNDLSGRNPPIQIVDATPSVNGLVTVDRAGTSDPADDVIRYTPNPGFSGTDQFSYTILDSRSTTAGGPVQSTATVTVFVRPGGTADDEVRFRLQTSDLSGNPISTIAAGNPFLLQVYVRDLRADDGDGDSIDRRGIGAAYLDLLYDLKLVSVAGNIQYGSDYQNVTTGNTSVPGLIDEVGAFQTNTTDPLGPSERLLFSVPMNANAVGAAQFKGDPADISPFSDTLLFEPPREVALENQQFTNSDLSGLVQTLQIIGSGGLPTAVDDTFRVASNTAANILNVLSNDLVTTNPPLQIVSVGARSEGGSVSITSGGTSLSYTPRAGFSGTEEFTYVVRNNVGLQSTATVTVQVGTAARDINFRLAPTDLNDNPITQISAGSNFKLQVYVQDLRTSDGDGDTIDERGVFAAYMDLLYNSTLVSPVANTSNVFGFEVAFGSSYSNGLSGNINTLNVIDDLGAFQTGTAPLGPTERLLATVTFQAKTAGSAVFNANPADVLPLHETLLFEPTDAVAVPRINFGTASLTVIGGGEGELVLTNPLNRFDVDDNGSITPRDVLLIVNSINRLLSSGVGGEGEGSVVYLDVNGDRSVTPMDALQVVNRLNQLFANGEGEGELTRVAVEDEPLPLLYGPSPLITSQLFLPVASGRQRVAVSVGTQPAIDIRDYAVQTQSHDQAMAAWDGCSVETNADSWPSLEGDTFDADSILSGWGQR